MKSKSPAAKERHAFMSTWISVILFFVFVTALGVTDYNFNEKLSLNPRLFSSRWIGEIREAQRASIVRTPVSSQPVSAARGQQVQLLDHISTGVDGFAEILFSERARLSLGELSSVKFQRNQLDSVIQISRGNTELRADGEAVIEVQGQKFILNQWNARVQIFVLPNTRRVGFKLWEGQASLRVPARGESRELRALQTELIALDSQSGASCTHFGLFSFFQGEDPNCRHNTSPLR